MTDAFDPGALLGRSYLLEEGLRVRLRLARPSDGAFILGLLERQADDFEVRRLVNFDPRRKCVMAATALIDGGERMVGVGSIPLDGEDGSEPDALIVDADAPEELRGLLAGALQGRAAAVTRGRR